MKKPSSRTWALLAICVAALSLAVGLWPWPAKVAAMPPPLATLVNPSFEGGFSVRGGASEVEVANGWTEAYLEGDHPWCKAPCHRPEYKPEQQEHLRTDGQYSQRWFTTYSRNFGVIYQRVAVQRGQWYEFSCNMLLKSNPPGGPAMFVGIQPWGAGVFDRQMVWGEENQEQDQWVRMRVVAQAWGDHIVVAAASNPRWPTKEAQTTYLDQCALTLVEDPGTPGPCDCETDCPCQECPGVDCARDCPGSGGPGCTYAQIRQVMEETLADWLPALRPTLDWPEWPR